MAREQWTREQRAARWAQVTAARCPVCRARPGEPCVQVQITSQGPRWRVLPEVEDQHPERWQ